MGWSRTTGAPLLLLVLFVAACGSSGGGAAGEGDAGAGSGGSLDRMGGTDPRSDGNSASSADCVAFDACGGDPEGSWNVDSICFFEASVLLGRTAETPGCEDLLEDVTVYSLGSYQFESGMLQQDVAYALDLQVRFTPECVDAATGGDASEGVCEAFADDYLLDPSLLDAQCALADGGCDCTLMTTDREFDSDGEYAVDGDQLDFGGPQDFCVDGDTMRLRVMAAGLDGILTFSRQ